MSNDTKKAIAKREAAKAKDQKKADEAEKKS